MPVLCRLLEPGAQQARPKASGRNWVRGLIGPSLGCVKRASAVVLVVSLTIGLAACGNKRGDEEAITSVSGPALVDAGEVVVIRRDGTISAVSRSGDTVDRLGTLPPGTGEPDAVAVSADGTLVLVSTVRADDDDSSVCAALVFQVLAGGKLRELAQGAAIALSGDGTRLVYFRHGTVDGFCRRTALVVRNLPDGVERTVMTQRDAQVLGTPPEWPVNWSTDSAQIAHVTKTGVALTQVASGVTTSIVGPGTGPLAPAWLPDGRLVVLQGCCIGPMSVRSAASDSEIFPVSTPVRSMRAARDGFGVWFTAEDEGLLYWDGRSVTKVFSDALLTSG